MPEILLLGHPKSATSRKAKRWFSERRIAFHDRDLRKRPASPNELRRWVDAYGAEAVTDRDSAPYVEQGLAYLAGDTDDWLERFAAEPRLLRLPLVRYGTVLAVGDDEDGWARIADAARHSSDVVR